MNNFENQDDLFFSKRMKRAAVLKEIIHEQSVISHTLASSGVDVAVGIHDRIETICRQENNKIKISSNC